MFGKLMPSFFFLITTRHLLLSLSLLIPAYPLSLRTDTLYPAPNPVLILLSEQGFNISVMGSSYKPVVHPNTVLIMHSTPAIAHFSSFVWFRVAVFVITQMKNNSKRCALSGADSHLCWWNSTVRVFILHGSSGLSTDLRSGQACCAGYRDACCLAVCN